MQVGIEEIFRSACDFQSQGKPADAERLLRLIVSRDPSHGGALYGLAMIAMHAGHLRDAEILLQRCVVVRPDVAGLHCDLAEVHRRRGDIDGAVEEMRRALAMDPSQAQWYGNVAILLSNSARHEQAVQWARQALQRNQNLPAVMVALGQSLMELGEREQAAEALRRCLAIDPGNELAQFFLAAATGAAAPPAAPAQFVVQGFDDYADRFDKHLQERLGYRVPELLRRAVDRVQPEGELEILDLGCGTGLAGVQFRDRARSMVGVDLSERMLERAAGRGIYARLERADLLASLRARAGEFGLILAADVFVYVGELREVFAAAVNALRPGGLFAFSVESHAGTGENYVLRPTRRYAYSRAYIEKLAADNQLDVAAADEEVLRRDGEQDVQGIIYVLRRGSAT